MMVYADGANRMQTTALTETQTNVRDFTKTIALNGAARRRETMLRIRPIHLQEAREYVGKYHRHNIPPVGGKFAVSCYDEGRLCGVAICGRPTARRSDNGTTLEIYRNCTDGTYNACSKLYGACCRIAKDMGYQKVITYTLESENGASLRASNFYFDGLAGGVAWTGKRHRDYYISPEEMKNRWVKTLIGPQAGKGAAPNE